MHERIKELRKKILEISQEEFAKSINISRSTLAGIETGIVLITDRIIRDICKIYDINEEWLRSGSGEIFSKDARINSSIHFQNYELKILEEQIIKQLSHLNKDNMQMVLDFIKKLSGNKISI